MIIKPTNRLLVIIINSMPRAMKQEAKPMIFFVKSMYVHRDSCSIICIYSDMVHKSLYFRESNIYGFFVADELRGFALVLGKFIHKIRYHIQNLGYSILIFDIYKLH